MIKLIRNILTATLVAMSCAGPSSASQTFSCNAGHLVLMFHFGSEGFSDLQVYESSDKVCVYSATDFNVFDIKKSSSKKPLNDGKISLRRNTGSKGLPAIALDIQDAVGELVYEGRRYRVACEWDD